MTRTILALLVCGCAAPGTLLKARFVDTEGLPEEGTAHVCIVQKSGPMDCLTLSAFFKLMKEERHRQMSTVPTSEL